MIELLIAIAIVGWIIGKVFEPGGSKEAKKGWRKGKRKL